jgi:Pyruvate/2-oxoacid:ferredoxin oxidoreductase delta subunit
MRRELRAAARNGLALPEVAGERCVHSLMEKAACRACMDACPRDAWVIDDDMLGIDGDRCDGCDLCVPVCPQRAIEGRFSASLKATDQGGAAFAACEQAGVRSSKDGLMPCLHAIGMSDLLRLRRDGAGFLITSRGDCERCERGGARRLDQRLDETNRLLESRGLELLVHRSLAADAWDKAFRRIRELAASRSLDRRAFFRSAIKLPKERVEAVVEDAIGSFVPPGMLLPEGDAADPLFPYVPRIDSALCIGCDACVRLCPHQAIELHADEQHTPLFLIHAERCSGCGICTDVCECDAVTIDSQGRACETRIPLRERRCPACGAEFHVPAARTGAESLCQVCRNTNHHGNLYQVLD